MYIEDILKERFCWGI